jgi:hypothetical protein|tara:strand:+ start:1339 stop:1548 length:210 start_codon:yes stop_codon:yes gene_type:complete
MWKVYKWNGTYIQGDLVSKHRSEDAAIKKATKEINFVFAEKVENKKETLIWLDDKHHDPVGVIVKKVRG